MPGQKYKTKFWIVICALVLLFCIGGSAAVLTLIRISGRHEISCKKCHPEIYQLWKDSKGHPSRETGCFECHAGAHLLVPPEFLADDDLTSLACLNCHEEVLALGYKIKKEFIKFNHRQHLHEGMECVDCHRSSGHEYRDEGTNRPSIRECQDCHSREFEGPPKNLRCLNCHRVMLAPGQGSI